MTAESLFAELEPPEETHSVGTYRFTSIILSKQIFQLQDYQMFNIIGY